MGKDRGEAKKPGFLIYLRGLDLCDLMPAKALADNVQPVRQRGISEGAVWLAEEGSDGAHTANITVLGRYSEEAFQAVTTRQIEVTDMFPRFFR